MNKINPTRINGIIKEVANKKEATKEVAQEAVKEIKTQTSNLGRDLVKTVSKDSPNVSLSELMNEGYTIGSQDIVYKMDHKKELYKAFKFDKGKVSNITIQDTTYSSKHSVVTQKLEDGSWASITNQGEACKIINGNPSERALKKATELQFDGYKIVAQDEKSLTFNKDDVSVIISKTNGKEI